MSVIKRLSLSQAAQAQDVNKLFNTDTVTQRAIYRDFMRFYMRFYSLDKAKNVQIKVTYFKV